MPTIPEALAKHYLKIKEKYPDAIIVFQNGQQVESFNQDAKTLSEIFGTTLIELKDKKATHHTTTTFKKIDLLLHTLVKRGFRVAICEPVINEKSKN